MIKTLRNLMLGYPILTIFDITKLCNQRCPMCNIWKSRSNSMTVEQIDLKAKELTDFGIKYVFLQGGEPTVRKDLIQIIDTFIKYRIKPTVITNGILLKKDLASEIAKRKCNLAISIDSLDEELFKKLRGVNVLKKVLNNIQDIKDIKRKGNWSITTTVSALSNPEDINHIREYALQNGFMHAIRPYIFVSGTAGKKVDEMIDANNKVLSIFEDYLNKAQKENYLASIIYKWHIKYLKKEKMPMCDAMKRSFLMKEDGEIAPCIEFPDLNITLSNFKEQYNSLKNKFADCNCNTPCFYNDAREIGILWNSKTDILLHLPLIIKQLSKYGNFF